jgi:hypothetical protein
VTRVQEAVASNQAVRQQKVTGGETPGARDTLTAPARDYLKSAKKFLVKRLGSASSGMSA